MKNRILLFLLCLIIGIEGQTVINSCGQLQNIDSDMSANYILGTDISCYGFDFRPIGSPIRNFRGSLDGRGFSIKGLTINKPTSDYVALFSSSSNGANFSNINFEDANINGRFSVAILVGIALDSNFNNIKVGEGTILQYNSVIGQ